MKHCVGVRHIKNDSYEVNFSLKGHPRVQTTIKARDKREAFHRRSQMIADALKTPFITNNRNDLTFPEIWPVLERNVISDGLAHKTLLILKCTYDRMFVDFRDLKYPAIVTPSQLTVPFFLEYKSYYGVDLERGSGVRAELQRVKMIMHRLRQLEFCDEKLLIDLSRVKRFIPEQKRKHYAEITATDLKAFLTKIRLERPDLYAPVYFMLRTGRRVEETTLIERDDITWEGFNPVKINIRAETTKMERSAPLNYLDDDLQAHIRVAYQNSKKYSAPYLFLNRQHQKINQKRITEYLGDLSEVMLKTRITCHYFRHRFCTETCKARLPLVDIQAISGIKNIEILVNTYCHSSTDGQASVLEKTRI